MDYAIIYSCCLINNSLYYKELRFLQCGLCSQKRTIIKIRMTLKRVYLRAKKPISKPEPKQTAPAVIQLIIIFCL